MVQDIYFQSTRGIKHKDPLSPSLIVISVELMSILINNLQEDGFISYSIEKIGPFINHLYYVDDKVLFSSGVSFFIKKMMHKLEVYEHIYDKW